METAGGLDVVSPYTFTTYTYTMVIENLGSDNLYIPRIVDQI